MTKCMPWVAFLRGPKETRILRARVRGFADVPEARGLPEGTGEGASSRGHRWLGRTNMVRVGGRYLKEAASKNLFSDLRPEPDDLIICEYPR